MDADQLPDEAPVDESRPIAPPKGNKRQRESVSTEEAVGIKRAKQETQPVNPEVVEIVEIDDDPEPELVEDEVVEVNNIIFR